MAIIWFIFIIFPCHCAVYMYKIMILQKPLSQFLPNFTLILLLKCDDSLFKWSCSIDCQAHIFFFKTKNCSNDDIFISCDDRIGKCCITSACLQWLCHSGERTVAHGPLVYCPLTWFNFWPYKKNWQRIAPFDFARIIMGEPCHHDLENCFSWDSDIFHTD